MMKDLGVGQTWTILKRLLRSKLKSAKRPRVNVKTTVTPELAEQFKSHVHTFGDVLKNPVGVTYDFTIQEADFKFRKVRGVDLVTITLWVTWEKVFKLDPALAEFCNL